MHQLDESISSSQPLRKKRRIATKEDLNLKYKGVIFDKTKSKIGCGKYFLINTGEKDVAKCKLCDERGIHWLVSTIGGSTSGMSAHLDSKAHQNDGKVLNILCKLF